MTSDREGFLGRWSRLKREVARSEGAPLPAVAPMNSGGAVPSEPACDDDLSAANEQDVRTARPSASGADEAFDLSALPRVEELTVQSDIRAFLDKRVPEALRNAALRQMWTLDPSIRDFIEVAENQWNWNIPGGAPGYEPIDAATTDMSSLLAQATGALTRTVETDHDKVSAQLVDLASPAEAAGDEAGPYSATHHAPGSDEQPVTVAQSVDTASVGGEPGSLDRTARATRNAAAQQDEKPDCGLADAPGRRHGRALPV